MIGDNEPRAKLSVLVAWPFPVVDSPQMKIQVWHKQVFWTVALVGGMLTWFSSSHVPALIDSQTKGMSNDVSSLKTDVAAERGDIQRLDAATNGMMKNLFEALLGSLKGAKKLSAGDARERLDFVASISEKAKQAGVVADSQIVAEAGMNTLELVNNPQLRAAAWNTVQQLAAYR